MEPPLPSKAMIIKIGLFKIKAEPCKLEQQMLLTNGSMMAKHNNGVKMAKLIG